MVARVTYPDRTYHQTCTEVVVCEPSRYRSNVRGVQILVILSNCRVTDQRYQ